MSRTACRKRPCKVCRRWFLPDSRLGSRQKTCASDACKEKWHKKRCKKWNRKNKAYFKGIYLQKKLAVCNDQSRDDCDQLPAPRIHLNLPRLDIAEILNPKAVIVADYIVEQIMGRMRCYPISANQPVEVRKPP